MVPALPGYASIDKMIGIEAGIKELSTGNVTLNRLGNNRKAFLCAG